MLSRDKAINEKFIHIEKDLNKELIGQEEFLHNLCNYFKEKIKRKKKSTVKGTLLDQHIVAGLGNIYADEALFAAKIHPARRSGSLTRKETELLLKSAREVMDKSIDSGGSTMATYVKADGTKGDYLEKFANVFRCEGKPCPRCGTTLIKTRIAGRGTHLCPHCQKESK